LPLVWVLLTSLKTRVLAYQIPPEWIFTPTTDNYVALFEKYPFPRYFRNSALVSSAATLLGLVVGIPEAYSFARFNTGGSFLRGWVLNNRTMPPIAEFVLGADRGLFDLFDSVYYLDAYQFFRRRTD
jgi:multiple sugar transport system permease protein